MRHSAPGVAGHKARAASVLVIKKLSRIVEGSSHSDADPQLIVIVLTPSGDAELTLLKVVLCLRPVTYEAWGSNP